MTTLALIAVAVIGWITAALGWITAWGRDDQATEAEADLTAQRDHWRTEAHHWRQRALDAETLLPVLIADQERRDHDHGRVLTLVLGQGGDAS